VVGGFGKNIFRGIVFSFLGTGITYGINTGINYRKNNKSCDTQSSDNINTIFLVPTRQRRMNSFI